MKLTISTPLALAIAATALALTPCSALVPEKMQFSHRAVVEFEAPPIREGGAWMPNPSFLPSTVPAPTATFLNRRSATISMLGLVFAAPRAVLADEPAVSDADAAEAAKERMRQRIAESKKNYRKPTDLVKERKDTTDYSCVSETGSPCPEGLVPRVVQREIVGALDKLQKSGMKE